MKVALFHLAFLCWCWKQVTTNASHLRHTELSPRIVGGQDAADGEFPFMVYWHKNIHRDSSGCGGSLVAPNVVLTAAHCAHNTGPIVIGSQYLEEEEDSVEMRTVNEKILHPEFNARSLWNDFAILVLDSSVDTISPIALNFDEQQPNDGDLLTVIGFGSLYETGPPSPILQKLQVPAYSRVDCKSAYTWMVRDDISLCAGYPQGQRDSCTGDSGGPILQRMNGTLTQVGVVSGGYGCARPDSPGIYARTSGAAAWLQEMICFQSDDPKPSYCPTRPPTPLPTRSPTRSPTRTPTNVPTSTPTPEPTPTAMFTGTVPNCIECTDIGDEWMIQQNIDCHPNSYMVQRKCNRRFRWRQNKYCQQSCFETGYGYDGDQCCT